MDLIGCLGKKVDILCKDGQIVSGYVSDVSDAEDSDIGVESVEISPVDKTHMIEIPVDDIESVTVDERFVEIDFRA